jgi:hypothetical protein
VEEREDTTMELDLIKADVYMTEHRLRIAHADRFGSLLPIGDASPAPKRSPIVPVTLVLALSKAVRDARRRRLAARGTVPRGDVVGAKL